MLNICAVSGGRADFGLLLAPLRLLRDDPAFGLTLVLTGQHLVAGASDGLAIAKAEKFDAVAVDMGLAGDDALAIGKAGGRALGGLAEIFARSRPDLVLLLGDRYEILCAALAATLARIPIAHIAGGDVTAGAMDDAFRHAITHMAHLHFVTSEAAARRVHQLGEPLERIHVTGSPGIDLMLAMPLMAKDEFFRRIGLMPRRRNIVVTYHPVTRSADSVAQAKELAAALAALGEGIGILVTGSNADPEGDSVGRILRDFAQSRTNATFVASLGSALYANALRHMDAMVGNSSSGLYEAPSFGLPTVNIGTRQEGRLKAASVFDCAPDRAAIGRAVVASFARGRQAVENPYGDGHASERIVAVLKSLGDPRALLMKRFQDMVA